MDARPRRRIAAAALAALLLAVSAARAQDSAVDPTTRAVRRGDSGTDSDNRPISRDNGLGGWTQTLAALAIVAGLLLGARFLLKRLAPATRVGRTGAVEVLARTALSARQQVILVRLGGRLLLLGSSGDGLRTLCEIADPAEAAGLLAKTTAGQTRDGDKSETRAE